MGKLDNRTALVTGGGSGIGLAVYNRLAKAAGFSVINVKGEENG